MTGYVKYAAKALFAGAVTGLTGAIAAAPDGYTTEEILGIVLAVLVSAGGVFGLTNGAKPGAED